MLHPKLAVKILQLLRHNENGMTVSHLKFSRFKFGNSTQNKTAIQYYGCDLNPQ